VAKLCVNVDHIATLRQARGGDEPDPVFAAAVAEAAGARGIVIHLRGDRRHIQERDLEILKKTIRTHMNVEMAATEEMLEIAERIAPDQVTLVPERPDEVTTEGGLDVIGKAEELRAATARLLKAGIRVSLFIDPDLKQIEAAAGIGAEMIEINTDAYSIAQSEEEERGPGAQSGGRSRAQLPQRIRRRRHPRDRGAEHRPQYNRPRSYRRPGDGGARHGRPDRVIRLRRTISATNSSFHLGLRGGV